MTLLILIVNSVPYPKTNVNRLKKKTENRLSAVPGYIFISISTPAGRFRFVRASITLGVGLRMSIILL